MIETPKNADNAEEQKRHWLDHAAVWAAVAAALAAAAAAGTSAWQGYVANQQLAVAKDTEHRQLRAYVFIDEVDLSVQSSELSAIVYLKNSGQTPAYDLTGWGQMGTQAAKDAFILQPKTSQTFEMSKTTIGPSTIVSPHYTLKIPANNIAIFPALQNQSAVIFTWGEVRYLDTFNTPWCLEFRLRSIRLGDDKWAMKGTPEGNKESQRERCPNWPEGK